MGDACDAPRDADDDDDAGGCCQTNAPPSPAALGVLAAVRRPLTPGLLSDLAGERLDVAVATLLLELVIAGDRDELTLALAIAAIDPPERSSSNADASR